jgi:hypothetical protein
LLSKRKQCNRERVFDIGAVQSALDDNQYHAPARCEKKKAIKAIRANNSVTLTSSMKLLFLECRQSTVERNLHVRPSTAAPRHATRIPFLLDQISETAEVTVRRCHRHRCRLIVLRADRLGRKFDNDSASAPLTHSSFALRINQLASSRHAQAATMPVTQKTKLRQLRAGDFHKLCRPIVPL